MSGAQRVPTIPLVRQVAQGMGAKAPARPIAITVGGVHNRLDVLKGCIAITTMLQEART